MTSSRVERIVERVHAVTGETGYMTPDRARSLVNLMVSNDLRSAIEVGFAHGVSTCFIAAALEDMRAQAKPSVVTIDLESSANLNPRAEDLLGALKLDHRVQIYREPTCATWRLMRMLEEDPTPRFDLFFLDGAHSWSVDGFLFFLVDRLLRPGGWIVMDDLDWSFATSPTAKSRPEVRALPKEQRTTAQVGKVYELLIRTHPDYGDFRVDGQWGYARKLRASDGSPEVRTETVYRQSSLAHLADMMRGIRRR